MIQQWFRRASILLGQISFTMKKRILTVFAAISVLTLSFSSCTTALAEETYPDNGTSTDTSRLRLQIQGNDGTKSSISPDEDEIFTICVMAYREDDGILVAVQNGTSPEDIDMELAHGRYNIYITANMDGFNAPAKEKELPAAVYEVESLSKISKALPMCWKGKAELVSGQNTTIQARLSRLVSKTGLKIDMGTIKGLEIKSVRLCQGAGKIWPFMDGGSRIKNPSDAMDGDYASEDDIDELMAGETIWLYATENCQGILLPENTDPWDKTPDNIGDSAELCTYIELTGEWNGTASYHGSVTYRFFLGENATSDFNVRRNSQNCITLYLEKGSFGKVNWKLDTSHMNPLYWNMSSSLENNFHDREDFYVTENIRLDFSFDANGQIYWQNRDYSFTIAGIGENGKTVIRFDRPVNLGDGRFLAMGTCVGSGYYDIVLLDDETGDIQYILEYGQVRTPEVIAGPPGTYTDKPVDGFQKEKSLYINLNEAEVCLYLVDRNGYNINQGSHYGCDVTLPEWDSTVMSKGFGYSLNHVTATRIEQGETGSDSYVAKYIFQIRNDGTEKEWNRRLTESMGPGMMEINIEDRFTEISCSTSMGLYCEDPDVTMMVVPDESLSRLKTEFMYAVTNSSNLPIKVRGLKLNSMKSVPFDTDVMAVACGQISGFRNEIPLLVSKMPYTYCSLETGSAKSEIIDGKLCFAADDNNIDQSRIPNQTSMFHMLEADFVHATGNWKPNITGHLFLYGNPANLEKYSSEGYMNCGLMFYHGDTRYFRYDGNNGLRTDFTKYGDLLGKDYIRKFNDIIEVDFSINDNNEVVATASREADLHITLSGSLNGHIRCVTIRKPLFTLWGRYYSESVPFGNTKTFRLGSKPTVIDAGTLAEVFVTMRNIEYYSLVNARSEEEFRVNNHEVGTIREYLKPYGIDISIEVSSSDGAAVAVRFSGSAFHDYKISYPVKWDTDRSTSVVMVPSSHSGFDEDLEDDGCPPGALFKAEALYLQPNWSANITPYVYYMSK